LPLIPINSSASGGELICINHPSSSSNTSARHSL
jgi:hypothetical protein